MNMSKFSEWKALDQAYKTACQWVDVQTINVENAFAIYHIMRIDLNVKYGVGEGGVEKEFNKAIVEAANRRKKSLYSEALVILEERRRNAAKAALEEVAGNMETIHRQARTW